MNRFMLYGAPALGLAAACAPTMPIPAALDPGANSALVMVLPASGAQIYECRVRKGETDAYEWAFVAPDAELYDSRGRVIARHGVGPYWQASDGSRIEGKLLARADAPSNAAIPWLLLAASSTGPRGGLFSDVTRVQRVNTAGGTAPQVPCTRDGLGRQLRSHYSADYRFFAPQPKL
jgi:uncharacterized protein DUF3455